MKRDKSGLYLIKLNSGVYYNCKIIANKYIIDKNFILIYEYGDRGYLFINSRSIRTIHYLGKNKIELVKNRLYNDAMEDIDKYNKEMYCH